MAYKQTHTGPQCNFTTQDLFDDFQTLTRFWDECNECCLADTCYQKVYHRGWMTCDVLMIAPTPTRADDAIGLPLQGLGGKTLNKIINDAKETANTPNMQIGITTAVACASYDPKTLKPLAPTRQQIDACSVRLSHQINLYQPKAIVTLGVPAKTAIAMVRKYAQTTDFTSTEVLHLKDPEFIAQQDHKFELLFNQSVIALTELFKTLV